MVVTTTISETLAMALNKMLKHDFSQLPFCYEDKYYFVTTKSILSALSSYGGTISESKLNVDHAKVAITSTHTEDDDIFEVMSDVERNGATLIVDDKGIKTILTAYDTALFFQQWSEDTMHVREIERGLKDIINLSFKDEEGKIIIASRQAAVDSVSSNFFFSKDKLIKGLKAIYYLDTTQKTKLNTEVFNKCFEKVLVSPAEKNAGAADSGWEIKTDSLTIKDIRDGIETYNRIILKDEIPTENILKKAFPDVYGAAAEIVEFDNLVLGQYIQILLGPSWGKCQSSFKLEKENILYILEGVRKTRNKLAHFHDENITPQDRIQLRHCNDLLRQTKRDMLEAK